MKKILAVVAIVIAVSSFAAAPPVDEKITKVFKENFPHVNNTRWYQYESSYEVLFEANGVPCRITYDLDGKMLSVRRDYYEKDLPIYILVKTKERYKGKKIFGVTEISSDAGITYNIILEDDKHWITVKSDGGGNMSVIQKLRKA